MEAIEYGDYLYVGVDEEDLKWLDEEMSKIVLAFHESAKVKSTWYTETNIHKMKVN